MTPKRSTASVRSPTSLDLFAGAGGFSIGLEAAGFSSAGAVELDDAAARTWGRHFSGRRLWSGRAGDMRTLDPLVVKKALAADGIDQLDVITAGPPCQGFSRAGRAKLASLAARAGAFRRDPRNALYLRAIRFLEALRPHAFVFENVAGILRLGGTNMAEVVCRAVADCGYVVRCSVLNAAWYGVPQSRERVFIIGIRRDLGLEPRFPLAERGGPDRRGLISTSAATCGAWESEEFFVPPESLRPGSLLKRAVTVAEALDDLPPLMDHLELPRGQHLRLRREDAPALAYRAGRPSAYASLMRHWEGLESAKVHDHLCRSTPRDFDTFGLMRHGDRYPEALEWAEKRLAAAKLWDRRVSRRDIVPPYRDDGFPDKWRKLIPDETSWTVTAHLGRDTYSHIHHDHVQKRMISVREAARLQSFPDGFKFEGSMGQAFTQIGNAVPPLVAKAIGGSLKSALAHLATNPTLRSAA